MSLRACFLALCLVAGSGMAARAQDAAQPTAPPPSPPPTLPSPATRPSGVAVSTLAAPDAFSSAGRDTGLPGNLWQGASLKTVRTVLPLLATKTLSPAGAALARRVLATGAAGPQGAGEDPSLLAARAQALLAQGDPRAAAVILSRAPGVDRSPELAHAAAESALLAGDDGRACAVAQALGSGRDDIYWLRLRTYCQAIAGHPDQAQLTFDLAQAQAKDPVFARLMSAKIAGTGNPGAASLRNGLDVALSRSLGLDLAAAKPSPAVEAAMSTGDPSPPSFDVSTAPPDISILTDALMRGEPMRDPLLIALLEGTGSPDPKVRARAQAAMLMALALSGSPLTADARGQLAAVPTPEGRAPVGRDLVLDMAADQKLMGEAVLLALWTCADAGAAGPAIGDRIRIVRALHAVGLEQEARTFALEGLLGLR